MKVLLVAEGSGGHLIPALQVADLLARAGAHIKLWYAPRRRTARLVEALIDETMQVPRSASCAVRPGATPRDSESERVSVSLSSGGAIEVDPIPVGSSAGLMERLWRCGQLWHRAQRCFDTFAPDVVVGFGGWVSAPVVLAARWRRPPSSVGAARPRRIGCLLHEQNVELGKANRLLTRWVDQVAVSFSETQTKLEGVPSVRTGLPIRRTIGGWSRARGAERFGFDPNRLTLLVLGGSQGSRAINRRMMSLVGALTPEEKGSWQVLHLSGPADESAVQAAYASQGMRAWVAPYLVEMEAAYAQADLVIARAGASTIMELAHCGLPAILIPYPHAGAHQLANARLVEAVGGGLMGTESEATPAWLASAIRRIFRDDRLRRMMGSQIRGLSCADATKRLTEAIVTAARVREEKGCS